MHKQILDLIKRYSENNSNQRFGQILFNLAINQFDNSCNEENKLRDIYNDSDEEILERVKKQLQLFELQKKQILIKIHNQKKRKWLKQPIIVLIVAKLKQVIPLLIKADVLKAHHIIGGEQENQVSNYGHVIIVTLLSILNIRQVPQLDAQKVLHIIGKENNYERRFC